MFETIIDICSADVPLTVAITYLALVNFFIRFSNFLTNGPTVET